MTDPNQDPSLGRHRARQPVAQPETPGERAKQRGVVPMLPGQRFENWPVILETFRADLSAYLDRHNIEKEQLRDMDQAFFPFAAAVLKQHQRQLVIGEASFQELAKHLYNETFGFGAIGLFLENPHVEDILLDSYHYMDVVIRGVKHRIEPSPFPSDEDVRNWLQTVVMANQEPPKQINRSNPSENATLRERRADGTPGPADGARVFAFTQPLSRYTGFAIRKHKKEVFNTVEKYLSTKVAPLEFFHDLDSWVKGHRNIVISGATGSGKTTLVNFAGALVPAEERLLVLEDTQELQIQHKRVLYLNTVEAGARAELKDDQGIPMRDLLRAALRLRPDRIIVGEVRDKEAFDMLDALNTGHAGSFTTLHANAPVDAITRLEMMALRAAVDVPIASLQDLIGSVINVVIQIQNLGQGERRIVAAEQLLFRHHYKGIEEMEDVYQVRDNVFMRTLWRFDREGGGQLVKVNDIKPPDFDI